MLLSIKHLDRICLIALFSLAIGGGLVVINSAVKERRQIALERDRISTRSKEIALADETLMKVHSALSSRREDMASLNQKIPQSASEIGGFLKELGPLMKTRDLTLLSIQPLSEMKDRLFIRIPVRMIFRGPFSGVYGILHDLETLARTVLIEKMVITRGGLGQDCQVDLTASIFRR